MIAEAFVYVIAVTLLIGLAALSVEQFLAEIRRPRRYAWFGAYAGALIFPPLSLLLAAGTPAVETVAAPSTVAAAALSAFDWDALVIRAWAVASVVLLLAYLAAWIRLTMLAKHWPRVANDERLVVLADNVGPAVLGVFRPRIVLPRWLLESPAAVRSTIMAHELEHIAARDQAFIVAAQLVTVLLPWNLPLWWFVRRLRASIEVDCDARVLRKGVDAARYAEVLLAVGQRRSFPPLAAATLIEPVTQLERRIRIMLTKRRTPSAWRMATAIGVVAILAACATQVDAPAIATQVEAPAAATRSEPADGSSVSRTGITLTGGTAVVRVRRESPGEWYEISAPELTVQVANLRDLHGTMTSVVKTPDRITLEGDVRFEFEGTSITASRAVAEKTPDGGLIVRLTNATAVRTAAPASKLSE